jgi:site-specific DNA-methyltransferase (adenine-specific)
MTEPYYQDDSVTIYHGDWSDILAELPRVDLVVTDPPYEVHAGYGGGEFGARDHLVNTGGFTDGGCNHSFLRYFRNWFVFCSRRQLSRVIAEAKNCERWNLLVWCKPNPVPTCCNKYLPDIEFIIHGFRSGRLFGGMDVKSCYAEIPCGNKETTHPNEKPLRLLTKLVALGSQVSEVILDPFMGSGTTLRAAKDLGRKAIGIEIEERYCEIAAKRMAQEVLNFA